MTGMRVRLLFSHMLVALVGAAVTFLVVRWMAPALFDENLQRMQAGQARGMGYGRLLRETAQQAVNSALLTGTVVGLLVAAGAGFIAARRIMRPVELIRSATRTMAQGRYDTQVSVPKEQELAALVTDVNRLGTRLAQVEAQRMRLIGEVAHEMRNPLTVIDGYVEAMIDGVMEPRPEELGHISAETRRLRRLADDLSALSRAEEGRVGLNLAQHDVGAVVGAAAERLRIQADDAEVTYRVDCTSGPQADIDPDRLAQVVTNLVGNALGATPSGGQVSVRHTVTGSEHRIEVEDTGKGLAEADVDRVFERFYRVPDGQRDPRDRGSGIGLTISRDYLHLMGGELHAASPGLGHGARFTATLPSSGQ